MTGTLGGWLGPFFAAPCLGVRGGARGPLVACTALAPVGIWWQHRYFHCKQRLGALMPRAGGLGHGLYWARRVEQMAAGAGGPGSLPRPPQVLRPGPAPASHQPLPPVLTPGPALLHPASLLTSDQAPSSPTGSSGGPGRAQGPGPPSRAASPLPSQPGLPSAWDAPWVPEPVEKSTCWKETAPSLSPGVLGKAAPRPAVSSPLSCRVV